MQTTTAVDDALCRNVGLETQGFVSELLPQLMDLVRASKKLPVGEEHAIRRGSRDFLDASKELGQRSLSLVHRTLCFLDGATHQSTNAQDLANFDVIIDSVDGILERVDGDLRAALAGPGARAAEATASTARGSASPPRGGGNRAPAKGAGQKPQVRWRNLINNQRTEFVPRILVKHNQKAPLDPRLVAAQRKAGMRPGEAGATRAEGRAPADGAAQRQAKEVGALERHLSDLGVDASKAASALPHPYEEELGSLSWPSSLFETRKPQPYPRMEDTPLLLVSNESDLRQMIQEIKATCQGKEIAVDVEHHDFRSYRGFVCLVQISTRQKDYVIDPFDIYEQMHELNDIFSDPGILKVLHGADYDVKWLQQDFSAYLVNMFDTGLATRALQLQGGYGLANLVQHCCNVKLDKKYQTADWRQRPLPPDFIYYARCDTHYLLYCYDCLRNALLAHVPAQGIGTRLTPDADLQATDEGVVALQGVLDKSTALCRQHYSESPLDAANGAMRLCERFSSKHRPLESRQFGVLQSLVQWRDRLARRMDESWNFISPDACLWRIALALPMSPSMLRSTCNPLPPILQQHAQEVVGIVASTTEGGGAAAASQPEAAPEAAKPQAKGEAASAESRPKAPSASLQPAQAPEVREWPSRATCSKLKPVVHVTVGESEPVTLEGLHAVLSALISSSSAAEESDGTVQEIRKAIRFATEAPEPEAPPPKPGSEAPSAEVEALLTALGLGAAGPDPMAARAAEPLGSEVEKMVLVQPQDVSGAPVAAPAQPRAMSQEDAPALAPKKGKKRRRQDSAPCLEDVAKAAAAEPHAATGTSDLPPETVQASAGRPKKKKRRIQEQPVDPYL